MRHKLERVACAIRSYHTQRMRTTMAMNHTHNHARPSDASACDRGECPTEREWRKQERLSIIRKRRLLREQAKANALAELRAIVYGD